jgi:hypothetical protein
MKLRFLGFLGTFFSGLCAGLSFLLRLAQRGREAVWVATTRENLRTLNVRQASRSRFN